MIRKIETEITQIELYADCIGDSCGDCCKAIHNETKKNQNLMTNYYLVFDFMRTVVELILKYGQSMYQQVF